MNDDFFSPAVYGLNKQEKKRFFEAVFLTLNQHHQNNSEPYNKLVKGFSPAFSMASVETTLPLSVSLFKQYKLRSVADEAIYKELNSSGTTGNPSRIFLDADTAKLQSKILVKTLQHWLGPKRRPMLLIDSPTTVKKSANMTARAAGLQGLSFLGYDHSYALDENMQLNIPVIEAFFEKHKDANILMFGFTFMVWQCFIQALQNNKLQYNLHNALLLHGGGWKKLQHLSVSNKAFKQAVQDQLGQIDVHDYYGTVEQTGTIYLECEHGYLHCPAWSDVLIRKAKDLSLCEFRQQGLIQVNSLLAKSYPGHCLLTEDIGEIIGEDDCACGRKGKYFLVHGRLAKAENRGCSDTFS